MPTETVRTGLVEANGTQLYHEIRGDGPPVVFIAGMGGDAGFFSLLGAEDIDVGYTLVTYDRRGNSRSPRPSGWATTSIEEQADDAAALIETLGLERPVVFGNSLGGTITVNMLERHAHLLRGAIIHEPGLPSVHHDPGFAQRAADVVAEGMAAGGPPKALEFAITRLVTGGAALWDAFDAQMRERVLGNAEVFFGIEYPALQAFVPDTDKLVAVTVPVHAAYGEETGSAPSAEWLSETTGGPLHVFPGAHAPRPDQLPRFIEAVVGVLDRIP